MPGMESINAINERIVSCGWRVTRLKVTPMDDGPYRGRAKCPEVDSSTRLNDRSNRRQNTANIPLYLGARWNPRDEYAKLLWQINKRCDKQKLTSVTSTFSSG